MVPVLGLLCRSTIYKFWNARVYSLLTRQAFTYYGPSGDVTGRSTIANVWPDFASRFSVEPQRRPYSAPGAQGYRTPGKPRQRIGSHAALPAGPPGEADRNEP